MKEESKWSFIKENILSLVTVATGVVVLILQALGHSTPEMLSVTTLALVALLATSGIVETRQHLAKIDEKVKGFSEEVAEQFDNLAINDITADEAYEYMSFLARSCKKSIFWASPGPRKGTSSEIERVYEKTIESAVVDRAVKLSWVTCFDGKARADRAIRLLFGDKALSNLFIGHIDEQNGDLPLLSFIIYDEKTLITRVPFPEGGRGKYKIITSPGIVSFFLEYFEKLHECSKKLEKSDETHEFLEGLLHTKS